MNPITFNDVFEHVLKQLEKQRRTDRRTEWPNIDMFNGWQHWPLFDYQTTRDKEQDLIRGMSIGGTGLDLLDWPFEHFRLSMTQTAKEMWEENGFLIGSGRYRLNAIVCRRDGCIHILAHIKELMDEKIHIARKMAPFMFYIADIQTRPHEGETNNYYCRLCVHVANRWLKTGEYDNRGMAPYWQGVVDSVAGFVLDAMTPTNHIAEVRPNEPERSVQWTHARIHYTLITHGHPANKVGITHGARVTSDATEELYRMAHNRRAHKRLLQHPRYRFKRGQRINVRATWVGPKEWQDEGGRQIYRILEESKWQPKKEAA